MLREFLLLNIQQTILLQKAEWEFWLLNALQKKFLQKYDLKI